MTATEDALRKRALELKNHAWLERFRKANYENRYNEMSPIACNDIAFYVDDFINAVIRGCTADNAAE